MPVIPIRFQQANRGTLAHDNVGLEAQLRVVQEKVKQETLSKESKGDGDTQEADLDSIENAAPKHSPR